MSNNELPNWEDAPTPIEVDLTSLDREKRVELLMSYIDQGKASEIVRRIDGSADNYESNIRRIDMILGMMKFGLGNVLKVLTVV